MLVSSHKNEERSASGTAFTA